MAKNKGQCSRVAELESALRATWLYDSFLCQVCFASVRDGDLTEITGHEPDCIVPSLYVGEVQRGR